MVLNQNNLMYLPPSKVIAAGTNKRKLMQAGMKNTWEQEIDERMDYITYRIDELLQKEQNLKQAGVLKQVNPEEQRNLKIASIYNKANDEEVLDTMLEFIEGDMTGGYQPPAIGMMSDNSLQSNLKQASIAKKSPQNDIEMLNTFLEFGGLP
jgi:uncharacterized protein YjgD (DUF1641 family)